MRERMCQWPALERRWRPPALYPHAISLGATKGGCPETKGWNYEVSQVIAASVAPETRPPRTAQINVRHT